MLVDIGESAWIYLELNKTKASDSLERKLRYESAFGQIVGGF